MRSSDQSAQSDWRGYMLSKRIAVILTLAALARAAFAQDQREWDKCIGREGPIPEVVIKGCSQIIEDTQNVPKILATAHNNRGVAYRLKGEHDLALNDYDEAIRLNPNSANYYNNRGIIFRLKHDYDRAITEYGEAIWLKHDYVAAYYNRALAYSDKGEYDKALTDFGVALQFNPKNALALYTRGITFLKKGDAEAAQADIDAARTINPNIAKEFDRSQ
jgi:tetratricopeptide (TPR) repeat protein